MAVVLRLLFQIRALAFGADTPPRLPPLLPPRCGGALAGIDDDDVTHDHAGDVDGFTDGGPCSASALPAQAASPTDSSSLVLHACVAAGIGLSLIVRTWLAHCSSLGQLCVMAPVSDDTAGMLFRSLATSRR